MDSIFLSNSSSYIEDWVAAFRKGKALDLVLFFIFWVFVIPILFGISVMAVMFGHTVLSDSLPASKEDPVSRKRKKQYTHYRQSVQNVVNRPKPVPWTEEVCKWEIPKELKSLVHDRFHGFKVIKPKPRHIKGNRNKPKNIQQYPQELQEQRMFLLPSLTEKSNIRDDEEIQIIPLKKASNHGKVHMSDKP